MEKVIISVKQEIQRLWLGPVMSPKKNGAWFPQGTLTIDPKLHAITKTPDNAWVSHRCYFITS